MQRKLRTDVLLAQLGGHPQLVRARSVFHMPSCGTQAGPRLSRRGFGVVQGYQGPGFVSGST